MKRKVIKRSLAVLFSMVLLLSAITVAFVATAVSGTAGTIKWDLDSNGALTISGSGAMPNAVIWSSADKVPWHDYASSVKSISLGSDITTIGNYAFSGLKSLRNVTIPKNITTIGVAAFEGCENLRDVTFSEGLKTIEDRAFNKCAKLSEVVIPKTVESIGSLAFYDCKALTEITFLNPACVISESDGEGKAIDPNAKIVGFADSTALAFAMKYKRHSAEITEDNTDSINFAARVRAFFSSLIPSLTAAFSRIMEASSQLFSGQSGSTIPGASPAENTFANLIPYVQGLFRSLVTMLQGMPA